MATLKRPRGTTSSPSDAESVVRDLSQALTTKQRFGSIQKAQILLASSKEAPGELVRAGILQSIALQLNFITNRHSINETEVQAVCFLLRDVLQLVSVEERDSFLELPDAISLLADSFIDGNRLHVLSVIHLLSSSAHGSDVVLHSPQIASRVIRATLGLKHTVDEQDVRDALLLEVWGILKNLSYFSNGDIDCCRLVHEALPNVDVRAGDDKVIERVASTLRNMALSLVFRHSMFEDFKTLSVLQQLLRCKPLPARINAMSVLVTACSANGEASLTVVLYGDGIFCRFTKTLLRDESSSLRKRAACLIKAWLSHEAVGQMLAHDASLTDLLSDIALHDEHVSVRKESAEAIAHFARLVRAPVRQQQAVLKALSQLAASKRVAPMVVVLALQHVVGIPEMCNELLKDASLLRYLVHSLNEPSCREHACGALADIAALPDAHEILLNLGTVEAFVKCMQQQPNDFTNRRDHAARGISHLLRHDKAVQEFNKHALLLPYLINYARTTSSESHKSQAKQTICRLLIEL